MRAAHCNPLLGVIVRQTLATVEIMLKAKEEIGKSVYSEEVCVSNSVNGWADKTQNIHKQRTVLLSCVKHQLEVVSFIHHCCTALTPFLLFR